MSSENKTPASQEGASQRRDMKYYLRAFAAMCRNGGNITTLLISVALALVVWILVRVFAYPDTTKKINGVDIQAQITQYMKDNNLQITSMSDKTVDLELSGKSVDIVNYRADDFLAKLDLSTVRSAGTFPVEVDIYRTDNPDQRADASDYSPRIVTLVVEEIVTRVYNISADASGVSVTDDYHLDTITAEPSTVTITGSIDILNKINRVEARADVSGMLTETVSSDTGLVLYDSTGARVQSDGLEMSAQSAVVNIPVYPKKELPLTFTFGGVPTNFDIDSLEYTIQPESIMVAAPDESIFNLSELNIGTVNIADIKFNQTTSTIPISLKEGYKNLSGNNSARITWKISDYSKLDYQATNITVVNAPNDMDVDIITKELTLSVIGPSSEISRLSSANLFVTADLLGVTLNEGSQDVPVSVIISGSGSDKTQCWALGSYMITVNARKTTPAEE